MGCIFNLKGTNGTDAAAFTKLAAQAVGATEATIAHGLDHIPTDVILVAKGPYFVWESTAATITDIFITASTTGTVDILVK